MNSRKNSEEQNVEHFKVSRSVSIIIVVIAFIVIMVMCFRFSHKPSNSSIKYLTSSTSPSFDLTFTPNL
jgi:hypothetical protein